MRLDCFFDRELSLRPVEESDASLIRSWDNAPDLSFSNTLPEPMTMLQAQEFVSLGRGHLATNGFVLYIASVKEGDETFPIGYVQLYDYDSYHRRAAVGVMVAPKWQRRGYASRMLDMIIGYAMDHRFNQLYAEVIVTNKPAVFFFDHSPFHHTATLFQWIWDSGDYRDLLIYQLCPPLKQQ